MENLTLTLSRHELESLIRKVVREELSQLLRPGQPGILDDWSHEGRENPLGDADLLREALVTLREHQEHPEYWMAWEDFEAELDQAEAAGELPD